MTEGIYDNTGYHSRRSIRLRGYDYSRTGMYFITLCIHNHAQLVLSVGATRASPKLTEIPINSTPISPVSTAASPILELNNFGKIVRNEWERSFQIRPEFKMDEYVIMPDHMHAIVCIPTRVVSKNQGDTPVAPTDMRGTPMGPKPRSIGAMIAGFKSGTIKRINELRKTPGAWVWQRNYYEHIVRNEQSLYRIRQYIRNNPANWFNNPNNHLENEINELDETSILNVAKFYLLR
jgi:REP element-mobilizing transposase RayT